MRYGKFYELKVRVRSRGAVGQFIGIKKYACGQYWATVLSCEIFQEVVF